MVATVMPYLCATRSRNILCQDGYRIVGVDDRNERVGAQTLYIEPDGAHDDEWERKSCLKMTDN